jgi:iron complex transport system ATP-binding protein
LEVENLSIRRGKVEIVSHLNWEIEAGEHWIILGANGSGKTSLLSALLGYMSPTEGEIRVMGEEFGESDWRALRTKIGLVSSSIRQMMPEHEPALISVASGRLAMIDFWGTPTKADQARARKILRQVDCAYAADRPWMYLSQGERQRVLIGRALMAKPKLLILDEPCAGLDPAAREHFLQFIECLGRQRNAPALVLVTHHVEEIMPVFTHVLLLKQGRALAKGRLSEVLNTKNLSDTFSSSLQLRKKERRYTLHVA